MLYHLLYPLSNHFHGFNVFRYVTFRSVYAAFTAFLLCLLLGRAIIERIRSAQMGEKIRSDGPSSHSKKAGTPSMGGILILVTLGLSMLLWVRWDSKFLWIAFFALVWYGLLGFADDYMKLKGIGKSRGIPSFWKLVLQTLGAILIVYGYLDAMPDDFVLKTSITVPFFKHPLNLDTLYPLFAVLVIVSASNSVNLTDGLDGLAIGCTTFAAMAFVVITYVVGNVKFSEYLKIINVPGAGELTVLCAALVGAGLGFLWFNAPPAQVFMGDTGSLALGGLLGTVAVLVKQESLLLIVGGIFVAEALSVIIQVTSFKMSGKRVFKMAPLHHHFELSGVPESKLIVRFWIVAIILTLVTLSTLKLR
ncbi:MAG TPA: phospho-N-acetylmuramoyl-pentapeptide-transferase [bacterium]|nr:phospho-N-acetylmuramoyl-pentapeptide-transferase [bacterium]